MAGLQSALEEHGHLDVTDEISRTDDLLVGDD
jgi:hypothetical protein